MQSKATTVQAYLASLPEDRREAINAIRRVFLEHMDPKLKEGMSYGMIGYAVPHEVYPNGYHCNPSMPLPYAGLASQKGYMSLSLMSLYIPSGEAGDGAKAGSDGMTPEARWFKDAWTKTGRKLDMGKACVRFKALADVPLDVLAAALKRVSVDTYIRRYEATLAGAKTARGTKAGSKPAAKKVIGSKTVGAKRAVAKKAGRKATGATTGKKAPVKKAAKPRRRA